MILLSSLLSSGCSTIFGNVKPIDEKSESYRILELSARDKDWVKIASEDQVKQPEDETESDVSDIVYQSKATASVISLNSACRKLQKAHDLRTFTGELLYGISDISERSERKIKVAETHALETTLIGFVNQEKMKLRTVVLTKGDCIYDLMYISRPKKFLKHENDFSDFVASLRLR